LEAIYALKLLSVVRPILIILGYFSDLGGMVWFESWVFTNEKQTLKIYLIWV
jgi:lipopolysaccharide/colanic/teichoic acid biosynthesis glycosyltransferase